MTVNQELYLKVCYTCKAYIYFMQKVMNLLIFWELLFFQLHKITFIPFSLCFCGVKASAA